MKYSQLVLITATLIFLIFFYTYFDPKILTTYVFIFLGISIVTLSIRKRSRVQYSIVRRTMILVPLLSGLMLLIFGIITLFPSKIINTIRFYTLGIGLLTIGILMLIMSMYVVARAGKKLYIGAV